MNGPKNKMIFLLTSTALLAGLIIGYFIFNGGDDTLPAPAIQPKKIAYWVAPMDANYRRDTPGKSPMGMDLIPIYEESDQKRGVTQSGFTIPSHILANLGVKTSPVIQEDFTPLIQATGRLTYDENKISRLQVRAEGWVERLYVRTIGEKVKKGDKLFALYSPIIATALGEYAGAQKGKSQILKKLSKGRLMALGLSEKTLNQAYKSGNYTAPIIFYAPRNGVVTDLGIRDGSMAAKNTIAFEITDTANLWLIADVYESDAKGLEHGAKAQIIGQDGILLNGIIDHIYPDLDPITRTIRLRLDVANHAGQLRPGQFFTVHIKGDSETSLTIPVGAVIRLGTGNHVILAHGDGHFEAAEVMLGKSAQGRVQILQGLKSGEKLVTSGQFLLDSESSFTGAKIRIMEASHD